ncbi:MAG: mannose-6-phosphate isomerase-like protein (cupin superfamily) [Natronomonas sp.]|jgi:mannose-6-phosphate isomerase-like protein (cupin superfamily)
MGYHALDPADLPTSPDHPCDRRSLTAAADLTTLAAAVYTLEPGEALAQEYHYHDQREELFYVLSGTLHVETPAEVYEVGAEETFVVEPESPVRPHNPEGAEGAVRVLGVGAPKFDIGKPYDPGADGEEGTDS